MLILITKEQKIHSLQWVNSFPSSLKLTVGAKKIAQLLNLSCYEIRESLQYKKHKYVDVT